MKKILTGFLSLFIGCAPAFATTTVGDKIGFTSGSPGGDTNTWGTVLNSMFTGWDEFFYAGREDRNMTISGGGKISYDNATGNVTFTSTIVFRNHITGFVNNVTTAASPVTLNATNRLGYVQLVRKPGADNNITSVTLVSSGSLPNTTTDADAGTFVLFQRTSDGTLWIPSAKKEIMSGDHWQVGTAQSWYERIASSAKPRFFSSASDTSQLSVPASTTSPAVVYIDGKLYANTSDKTLDLDTSGRDGVDTGAKAANTAYYLYAIPATSGRTFDIVCSVTAPTGAGPTGFSSWSYIGGFRTWGSSAINPFSSVRGKYRGEPSATEISFTSSTRASKTFVGPATARFATFRASFSTINAAGDQLFVSAIDSATYLQEVVRNGSTTAANEPRQFFEVEIITANTFYGSVTSNSDVCGVALFGWDENPMEYK